MMMMMMMVVVVVVVVVVVRRNIGNRVISRIIPQKLQSLTPRINRSYCQRRRNTKSIHKNPQNPKRTHKRFDSSNPHTLKRGGFKETLNQFPIDDAVINSKNMEFGVGNHAHCSNRRSHTQGR